MKYDFGAELEPWRRRGDPQADAAIVAILARLPEPDRRLLAQTLGRWDPASGTASLPLPVREYVEQAQDDAWIDDDRVERAQHAFVKHALGSRFVLGLYSLPILYVHPEISQSLGRTGRLAMHVRDRIVDTQAFFDAMVAPGSLRRGGVGRLWTRKVRLTHALMRHAELNAKQPATAGAAAELAPVREQMALRLSQPAARPMPLDQLEIAFTLQTFAWVIVEGLTAFGWPMPEREVDDYLYLWSSIGHRLGVMDELLPGSGRQIAGARELFEHVRDVLVARPDPLARQDDMAPGRLLIGCLLTMLVEIQRESLPEPYRAWVAKWGWLDAATQQLPRVLVRRLCGRRAARLLRLTRPPLLHGLVCRVALAFIDVREIAPPTLRAPKAPSGAPLSGALV